FCVSKEHARYMARKFTEAGLTSIALTGDDPPEVRDRGLGELKAAFGVARQDPLNEEVALEDQVPADRAPKHAGEDLCARIVLRPRPGGADHETREPLRVAGGDGEPDRTAPVFDHQRHILQVELLHKLLEDGGVLARRIAVPGRGAREAEPRVVRSDAAVAVAQPLADLAVQERPRRGAV